MPLGLSLLLYEIGEHTNFELLYENTIKIWWLTTACVYYFSSRGLEIGEQLS